MSNVHNRYVYDENIHVFVLDQTKTDDRVFKLTWRDTLKKLNNIMIVRLPDGMLDELKEVAKENKRSLNAEIIARLEGFKEQSNPSQLDRIEKKIDRLVFLSFN